MWPIQYLHGGGGDWIVGRSDFKTCLVNFLSGHRLRVSRQVLDSDVPFSFYYIIYALRYIPFRRVHDITRRLDGENNSNNFCFYIFRVFFSPCINSVTFIGNNQFHKKKKTTMKHLPRENLHRFSVFIFYSVCLFSLFVIRSCCFSAHAYVF